MFVRALRNLKTTDGGVRSPFGGMSGASSPVSSEVSKPPANRARAHAALARVGSPARAVDVRGEPFVTFDVPDAEFSHAETTGGHVAKKAEDDGGETAVCAAK